ncbi:MAG: Bug family tripartite tricarboxylate transporter substrate binding protein [Burkholderiales bacterium]
MPHRCASRVALLGLLACAGLPAQAADTIAATYPAKNIRLIIPFGAGGGADIVARRLAQSLTERWQRNVVADNRPGGTGIIGTLDLARATPDGYTLAMTNMSVVVSLALMAQAPLDLVRESTPVSLLVLQYTVLVVPPASTARTAGEFVEQMKKAKPGAYAYGSGGNGTPAHLAAELFTRSVGVKATHVPYKQVGIALTDLIRGELQFVFSASGNALPHTSAGRLRALAVAGPHRLAALPDVPTLPEAGLPDPKVTSWTGVIAPPGTSLAIRQKLHATLREIAREPGTVKIYEQLGLVAVDETIDAFGVLLRAETARWTKFVKEADLRPD